MQPLNNQLKELKNAKKKFVKKEQELLCRCLLFYDGFLEESSLGCSKHVPSMTGQGDRFLLG